MPLATGVLLNDRYRIDALLGQGGMGAVYDAWDPRLSVRCAIKENLLFTEANQRQFEREAQMLARLHHPHLPRVTDHFLIPGQGQYLVMDFVEGEDLRHRLERLGPLPEAEVTRWAEDVLGALTYLHQRHIIHRDIKPANIKINPEGRAVLVDFGIAKEMKGGGQTTTGAHGLTPGFAPPEQYGVDVAEGGTDARSDLYAFGATLYTLLTAQPPADALSRVGKPEKFIPLTRRAVASPGLASVIDKALAMQADERYPNAEAMLAALRAGAVTVIATGEMTALSERAQVETSADTVKRSEPNSISTSPTGRARMRVSWRNPWLWGGAGALGMVLIGVMVFLWPGKWPVLAGTPSPTLTGTPTASATLTPSPTMSPTATPTVPPTATVEPTLTPSITPTITNTPRGGGLGKIAFQSNAEGTFEIYVMNVDGTGLLRLTDNTVNDTSPAWSPDGTKIAFVSRRDGNSEIYVMNANGSAQTRLTTSPEADFSPAWSPDGTKIAFASARDGNGEIYVMNVDGSEPTRLTDSGGDDFDPVWSPDGKRLAFVSNRLSNSDIYVMNADGSQQRRLTDANGNYPAWSPDGTRLLFSAKHGQKVELFVLSLSTLRLTQLTLYPAHAINPIWAPDGTYIIFVSDQATDVGVSDVEQNEIYLMNADGTGVKRLTENTFNDGGPAWSP